MRLKKHCSILDRVYVFCIEPSLRLCTRRAVAESLALLLSLALSVVYVCMCTV
jgi:hypothetical protein